MSIKQSNDTKGNRTHDLPAVAQCLNQLRQRVSPEPEVKRGKLQPDILLYGRHVNLSKSSGDLMEKPI